MCRPDFKSSTKGVNTDGNTNTNNGDTNSTTKKTNGERIVSPHVPSGFARRKVAIGASMLGLTLFFNAMNWMFKDSTLWLRPADEFCQNSESTSDGTATSDGRCNRSDLFAFQASSAIMQLFMGGMGIYAWHITKRVTTRIPQTPEGRLFGYLEEADKLNVGIFVYQTWDFFASMVVPEHNTAIFLAHHMLASITSWMSLEYQMVHYYAVFFGGCSEISTIFLVLIDFDVYFPAEDRGSTWGMIITFCQVAFTFSFLYYRVIGWWQVSFRLWSDVFAVHRKGVIEDYRPGKAWFLYGFLVMDFLLGSLQVYWFFFGIVPKILEILS